MALKNITEEWLESDEAKTMLRINEAFAEEISRKGWAIFKPLYGKEGDIYRDNLGYPEARSDDPILEQEFGRLMYYDVE